MQSARMGRTCWRKYDSEVENNRNEQKYDTIFKAKKQMHWGLLFTKIRPFVVLFSGVRRRVTRLVIAK